MLEISTERSRDELSIKLDGRLDIASAPELEAKVASELDGVTKVVVDAADLSYISSAGLRVLRTIMKKIGSNNGMKVIHASEDVYEVLDITGFTNMITVKR